MGLSKNHLGTGRINHVVVRNLIQGGDTGGFSLWVGDVGGYPLHGPGPGEVPE